MDDRKTVIHFFTIADYEEEEAWLSDQHKNGWKLLRMIPPCFYVFEKCMPADVAYRMDYKNNTETSGYFNIFREYGWEYIGRCVGWLYFRRPSSEADSEQDGEIFSDNESRVDMIDHVVKTRLVPIRILLLCCVFPNLFMSITSNAPLATGFTVFFSVLALLELYLLIYCDVKLRKLRDKYKKD